VYWCFLRDSADAALAGRPLEAVFRERPQVAAAHRLYYAQDIEQRQVLEALLLTSESFEEIAQRLSVEPATIAYYEQLFFNVRDRMKASIWILKTILGPPQDRKFGADGAMTVEQHGIMYRLFAYYGGPLVLDALISGIHGLTIPKRPEDVAAFFAAAQDQLLQSRATSAAALLAFNNKNAIKLMRLAVRAGGAKQQTSQAARGPRLDEEYFRQVLSACDPWIKN
jgi:hypothetical protein